MRNKILLISLALTLVIVPIFAACAPAPAPAKPPIKIGIAFPSTGVAAFIGPTATASWEIYMDKIGWEVAGRKIELIFEDSEGKPDVAMAKVKKLVEADKVHILSGIHMSHVAYAIRDYVHQAGIPLIISNASAEQITLDPKIRSPYIFRTSYATSLTSAPMAAYAYHELGYRKMIIIASDYAYGREVVEATKKAWDAVGGEVVQEIWYPLGTNDFGPYIGAMKLDEADALYIQIYGASALVFSRQYVEYGMEIPLLGEGSYTDHELIAAHTEGGILGAIMTDHWSNALDFPENKYYVQEYLKRMGGLPGKQAFSGYLSAQVIVAALEAIEGDIEDVPRFLKALKEVDISDTPRGRFRFDANQNPILDCYFLLLEKVDGQILNVPIAVLKDTVSPYEYSAEHWKANFKKLR